MAEYVKLEDILGYLNAAGIEAHDAGDAEEESTIAGILIGIKSLDRIDLQNHDIMPSNIVAG